MHDESMSVKVKKVEFTSFIQRSIQMYYKHRGKKETKHVSEIACREPFLCFRNGNIYFYFS